MIKKLVASNICDHLKKRDLKEKQILFRCPIKSRKQFPKAGAEIKLVCLQGGIKPFVVLEATGGHSNFPES